jgi:multiple antibiotic resistance protein
MDLLKPLIALLAIVNPIGVLPFFIHFTQGFSRSSGNAHHPRQPPWRRAGHGDQRAGRAKIIAFFGISIASFQVGGGMLLLISALQMLNAQPAESQAQRRQRGPRPRSTPAPASPVVPLTIPLLTGPATISTMVIYAERRATGGSRPCWSATAWWWRWWFAVFTLSGRIARLIGNTGINVMTRLMGLILAALAVEIMADGLSQLFPALVATAR